MKAQSSQTIKIIGKLYFNFFLVDLSLLDSVGVCPSFIIQTGLLLQHALTSESMLYLKCVSALQFVFSCFKSDLPPGVVVYPETNAENYIEAANR